MGTQRLSLPVLLAFSCWCSEGNEGMKPIINPLWFPLRESPGSFPHSVSTNKILFLGVHHCICQPAKNNFFSEGGSLAKQSELHFSWNHVLLCGLGFTPAATPKFSNENPIRTRESRVGGLSADLVFSPSEPHPQPRFW